MKMPASQPQTRSLRCDRVVLLALLQFLLLHSLPAQTTNVSNASSVPRAPQPRPDGTLVVPVTDTTGNRSEPMVLVPLPVQARSLAGRSAVAIAPPRTNSSNPSTAPAASKPAFDESVLTLQVALARYGLSSGSFDGVMGAQTRAALSAFQRQRSLPVTGMPDPATWAQFESNAVVFTNYVVAEEDLGSLQPLGRTWLAKSQQEGMVYETILEMVSERTHSNPKLLRWLNPDVVWTNTPAGTTLKTVHAHLPPVQEKAAFLRIFLAARKLQAFGASSNVLVHFPCSIAARVDKRPLGEELHIAAIAPNPNYTFDPAVFPESEEARLLGRKLILQPGPNNPVGTVWLSLDKPGYGIHGTPKPEEVGRTESHGCFRLANWNVEYLLKLISVGTPVFVEP